MPFQSHSVISFSEPFGMTLVHMFIAACMQYIAATRLHPSYITTISLFLEPRILVPFFVNIVQFCQHCSIFVNIVPFFVNIVPFLSTQDPCPGHRLPLL